MDLGKKSNGMKGLAHLKMNEETVMRTAIASLRTSKTVKFFLFPIHPSCTVYVAQSAQLI